jgi:hypothetical protein
MGVFSFSPKQVAYPNLLGTKRLGCCLLLESNLNGRLLSIILTSIENGGSTLILSS